MSTLKLSNLRGEYQGFRDQLYREMSRQASLEDAERTHNPDIADLYFAHPETARDAARGGAVLGGMAAAPVGATLGLHAGSRPLKGDVVDQYARALEIPQTSYKAPRLSLGRALGRGVGVAGGVTAFGAGAGALTSHLFSKRTQEEAYRNIKERLEGGDPGQARRASEMLAVLGEDSAQYPRRYTPTEIRKTSSTSVRDAGLEGAAFGGLSGILAGGLAVGASGTSPMRVLLGAGGLGAAGAAGGALIAATSRRRRNRTQAPETRKISSAPYQGRILNRLLSTLEE